MTPYATLSRYIASCSNEAHLAICNAAVTLFFQMYGNTPDYNRLCGELQIKRIEIQLNAVMI